MHAIFPCSVVVPRPEGDADQLDWLPECEKRSPVHG